MKFTFRMRASGIAAFTFIGLLACTNQAFAGVDGGPADYSYIGQATYSGSGGSIGPTDYYPLPVAYHNQSVVGYIEQAEGYCRNAGYQACNFSIDYRDSSGSCEDINGPCLMIDASGISGSQQKPVSKSNSGPQSNYTVYYALTDISTSLTADPTTITLGERSKLTWATHNEYIGSTDPSTCSLNNGIGNVDPSGSLYVSPTVT
ncbi:MAG TPA: hypothetical protein VHB93_02175, partial [Candidatus Paceibacterota bacterium]|nr:hypothetical protein [Candidatus Paceibacterota bacterium]